MNLILLIVLAGTAMVGWWLSGYDSRVTGENLAADVFRRLTRIGATVFLIGTAVGGLLGNTRFAWFVAVALAVPVAVIWAGCGSEFVARAVHALIDSPGGAAIDPKKLTADLDRLAALFEKGRNEEALKLCTRLVESGEASALAMETMLFRIYDRIFTDERLHSNPSLAEVHRLIASGQFGQAESQLQQRLKRGPGDMAAALTLVRLYTLELRSPEKANAFVKVFEQRAGTPPFFAAYARQRLRAWSSPQDENAEGIESLLVGNSRFRSSADLEEKAQAN